MTTTPLFYLNDDAQLCVHLTSIHSNIFHFFRTHITSFLTQNLHTFTTFLPLTLMRHTVYNAVHPSSSSSYSYNLSLTYFTSFHSHFYLFILTPSHTFYPFTLTPTKLFTLAHSFFSLWPPCVLITERSVSRIFTAKSFYSHTSYVSELSHM